MQTVEKGRSLLEVLAYGALRQAVSDIQPTRRKKKQKTGNPIQAQAIDFVASPDFVWWCNVLGLNAIALREGMNELAQGNRRAFKPFAKP